MFPAVEETREEEKEKVGRVHRIALAIGKPFTKKSGTKCHLNVEVGG